MTPLHSSRARVAVLAAVAALVLGAPASALGAVSLAGWWPLAEGSGQIAHDISGHGNHGTLGSTPGVDANDPSWVRGAFWGSALSFDGNDFVQLPSSPDLEPQTLTVSLWFKAPTSPGPFKYLIAKGGDGCVSASWGLTTSFNGGLVFYVWNGIEQRQSGTAGPEIWDGRWHHAAGTFDGAGARLFIDGKPLGGSTVQGTTIDYNLGTNATTFGGYRAGCELMFTGTVDQVSLWSGVLPIEKIWKTFGWFLGLPTLQ